MKSKYPTTSDLSLSERHLNGWTPAARARSEAKYKERRPQDPDEDTIYNVLCPQIRATWSPFETQLRLGDNARTRALLTELSHPKNIRGEYVYPKA